MGFDMNIDNMPKGWQKIFRRCESRMVLDIDPEVEISWTVEPYGALGVYVYSQRPELQTQLNLEAALLEEISLSTCSECGEWGEPRNLGSRRLEVLCDEHYKQLMGVYDMEIALEEFDKTVENSEKRLS